MAEHGVVLLFAAELVRKLHFTMHQSSALHVEAGLATVFGATGRQAYFGFAIKAGNAPSLSRSKGNKLFVEADRALVEIDRNLWKPIRAT